MADKKITQLTEQTTTTNDDIFVVVDGTTSTTKKVQAQNILPAGSVGSTDIATNGVAAANLATSAITLGYTQITSNFVTASTTVVQVTGLTATVTIPSGGRRIKITAFA